MAPDDEARPRILEPLDPQETEEPPPILEEEELVPDVIADPPSGEMDVDLPGSIPEDVPELKEGVPGEVSFLGRKIFRRHHGSNHLYFGLDPGYLRSCLDEFAIQKPVSKLPPLERRMSEFLKRGKEMDEPLSPSAHERYRRVLGRLAGASLS